MADEKSAPKADAAKYDTRVGLTEVLMGSDSAPTLAVRIDFRGGSNKRKWKSLVIVPANGESPDSIRANAPAIVEKYAQTAWLG